jgi:hypothetical protein
MSEAAVQSELTIEAGNATTDFTKISFKTRRELIEAARILNPGDPLSTITTQHATVVTNALLRNQQHTR